MYVRNEGDQRLLDSIAEAMKTMREGEGLSQRAVAKLSASTQSRVSDIENGKADLFVLTLRKFALAFGYEVEISFIPLEDLEEE